MKLKPFDLINEGLTPPTLKKQAEKINADLSELNQFIAGYNESLPKVNILESYDSKKKRKKFLETIQTRYNTLVNTYSTGIVDKLPRASQIFMEGGECIAQSLAELEKALLSMTRHTSKPQKKSQTNRTQLDQLISKNPAEQDAVYLALFAKDKLGLASQGTKNQKELVILADEVAGALNPKQTYQKLSMLRETFLAETLHAEGFGNTSCCRNIKKIMRDIDDSMARLESADPLIGHSTIKDSPIAQLIQEMPVEKRNQFARILLDDDLTGLFSRLYLPSEKKAIGYPAYQAFIQNHEISYLGGANAKNFLIRHRSTGKSVVLKLEQRFGNPKLVAQKLSKELLTESVSYPVQMLNRPSPPFPSQSTLTFLVVMEYCSRGTPLDCRKRLAGASNQEIILFASNVYLQMAIAFQEIIQQGVAFPDAKNTNWLLDDKEKLRISDDKSFLEIKDKTNHQGMVVDESYRLVFTADYSPPELSHMPIQHIDIDKMHAGFLGINLCQFLSNRDEINFSHPLFLEPEGKRYKSLIIRLVMNPPFTRITISEAIRELEFIHHISGLKKQCFELIGEYFKCQVHQVFSDLHNFYGRIYPSMVIEEIEKDLLTLQNIPDQLRKTYQELSQQLIWHHAFYRLDPFTPMNADTLGLHPLSAACQQVQQAVKELLHKESLSHKNLIEKMSLLYRRRLNQEDQTLWDFMQGRTTPPKTLPMLCELNQVLTKKHEEFKHQMMTDYIHHAETLSLELSSCIPSYQPPLIEITDFEGAYTYHQQLKREHNALIVQKKEACQYILHQLASHKVDDADDKMIAYIRHKRQALAAAKTLREIGLLQSELETFQKQMDTSPQWQAIRSVTEALENQMSLCPIRLFFRETGPDKAEKIKQALKNLPLQERQHAFDHSKVQKRLAEHRSRFFEKKSYLDPDGEIDIAKAARSYKMVYEQLIEQDDVLAKDP